MSTTFTSPVGRLVQGSMVLHAATDIDNDPKLDKDGKQVQECFMAIAIAKNDPALPAFYALYTAQARASFPHLFDANGNCTHPRFAWKIQDGDGVDNSGKSVADKEGFAGHYIFKMATRYAPRCYPYGKYQPSDVFQDPDGAIKRGYYIRVGGTIDGNGVDANNKQAVPGLYVSPNLVELIAYGEEIVSGPDAAAIFGAAPLTGALPAGASTTPRVATPTAAAASNGLAPPPMPAGLPAAAAPPPPPPPAAAAPPPPPPPPAGPQYIMQPSAQGVTREQMHAAGWNDEQLIVNGHMVKVG